MCSTSVYNDCFYADIKINCPSGRYKSPYCMIVAYVFLDLYFYVFLEVFLEIFRYLTNFCQFSEL